MGEVNQTPEPRKRREGINRRVVPDRRGFLKDANTGRALEATDEKDYQRYLQRRRACAEEGRNADKLVSMVGRFFPKGGGRAAHTCGEALPQNPGRP